MQKGHFRGGGSEEEDKKIKTEKMVVYTTNLGFNKNMKLINNAFKGSSVFNRRHVNK